MNLLTKQKQTYRLQELQHLKGSIAPTLDLGCVGKNSALRFTLSQPLTSLYLSFPNYEVGKK